MYVGSDRVFEVDKATIALGVDAGVADYSTLPNIYIGSEAGKSNQIGWANICIGHQAGKLMTSSSNSLIGYQAGDSITSGHSNVCIGVTAGATLTTNSQNVFIGASAGVGADCEQGVFIGSNAGATTTGSSIFIFTSAGISNVAGQGNIGIGRWSLFNQVTANYNTAIGYRAGFTVTGGGNIFLGSNAGYRQAASSDLLIVDNRERADAATEATNAILYGTMAAAPANQTLKVNAVLNVTENIQVDGTQVVTNQQAHIADADNSVAAAAGDPPTQAEFNALVTAYNDLATKFNTLLTYLDADAGHGLLAGAP